MSHGHEDHHDSDSHGHGHGHHAARKWYENEEGIVYHPAEIAAYRVNGRKAGKCVNLYIPLKDCLRTVSKLDQAFDPSIAYSNNSHVLNAFFNAPQKASSEADKIEVTSVKVDLTVLLRIIKHAKEANFKLATGQLHGVFAEKNIEITNCYAVPNKEDDVAEDDFDNSMTARLEEVNMDNNKVGWYQISYANDHLSGESVATTFDYQNSVPYAVYLVYDILEVERGLRSPFKAYRINNKYMDLMKNDKVTYHQMKSLNFKVDKIYQEVPLEIVKTPLQLAYLHEQKRSLKNKFSSTKGTLDLIAYFERTISFLVESLEDQAALDLKMQHDHFAGLKNETKETRIKNLEIPTGDFVETFVSKQRINNFLNKINNCGKFQLETSFLLSENKI